MTGCAPSELSVPKSSPQILLFNGTGASPNDVAAVEAILSSRRLRFATANSEKLNGMSAAQLREYKLLIIPGGNYIEIGKGLSEGATANIRSAVEGGLNYLGICAGGILAGKCETNCVNLTGGVKFDFYGVVKRGVHKTAVAVTGPDGTAVEHYWEDGPQFTGWGDVLGKYPDGTPAVVESECGKGWVVLCGVHPEAPES